MIAQGPAGASYVARIERDGVQVTVEVTIDPEHAHSDIDETTEIVAMSASRTSMAVQQSIASGQIRS